MGNPGLPKSHFRITNLNREKLYAEKQCLNDLSRLRLLDRIHLLVSGDRVQSIMNKVSLFDLSGTLSKTQKWSNRWIRVRNALIGNYARIWNPLIRRARDLHLGRAHYKPELIWQRTNFARRLC